MASPKTSNRRFGDSERASGFETSRSKNMGGRLSQGEFADEVATEKRAMTKRIGASVGHMADRMRGHKFNGRIGSTVDGVASKLHSAGDYLENHDTRDLGRDITNVIRRNPLPSAAVGLGLGILVASAFRKGSEDKTWTSSEF